MISASLVVEGHGPPYMTYPPEHYGPPPKAEFARPLPKARYNGDPVASMGRIVQGTPATRIKYETSSPGPVNLVQPKEEPSRMFSQTHHSHYSYLSPAVTYPTIPYPNYHMPALFRPGFIPPHAAVSHQSLPPPLAPPVSIEQYSPPQSTTTPPSHGFLSPNDTHSPTALPGQSLLKRQPNNFKVPSGKEGSLKHRILRTPGGAVIRGKTRLSPTNHHPPGSSNSIMHPPPPSPSLPINSHGAIPSRAHAHTNNNTIYSGFNKGSHIQLSNGEMKRVEEMRTEDFVQSAENDPELRLADSTVVRIRENGQNVTLTLSYNEHRTQANFEASIEHPFFVYGQGWASCKPDLTLIHYGLKCNRLQVGDICISLTPREKPLPPKTPTNTSISHTHSHSHSHSHRSRDLPQNLSMHQPNHLYKNHHHDRSHSSTTVLTTATTTAMTARPTPTMHSNSLTVGFAPGPPRLLGPPGPQQIPQLNRALSADACSESVNSKKRRWSAPDNISDDPTQPVNKKHKE